MPVVASAAGLVGLGIPEERPFVPSGVSIDGSVIVGNFTGPTSFDVDAARWTSQDGFQPLAALGDGPFEPPEFSRAVAISDDGSLVVGTSSGPDDTYSVAVQWRGTMPAEQILAASGYAEEALAVTGDASKAYVRGDYLFGADSIFRRRGNESELVIQQDFGLIVGPAATTADGDTLAFTVEANVFGGPSKPEAWIWNDGATQAEPLFPESLFGTFFSSSIGDISSDGSAVVGSTQLIADGFSTPSTAFVLDPRGPSAMSPIPPLDGFLGSHATDVADTGLVAGVMEGSTENAVFLWDPHRGTRLLEDELAMLQVDVSGWTAFTSVGDLTSDGRYLVGTGINAAGNIQAFRVDLLIPEPSGVLWIGGVVVCLMRKLRREGLVTSTPVKSR